MTPVLFFLFPVRSLNSSYSLIFLTSDFVVTKIKRPPVRLNLIDDYGDFNDRIFRMNEELKLVFKYVAFEV